MKRKIYFSKKVAHISFGCLFVLCTLIIFFFSNQNASESYQLTGSFITEITKEPITQVDWDLRGEIVGVVRKLAHVFIYFVLGSFLGGFLETSVWLERKRKRVKIVSYYLIIIIHACLDEIHQLFIAGRGSSIIDVVIDVVGASLGLCTIIILKRMLFERGKKHNAENCV